MEYMVGHEGYPCCETVERHPNVFGYFEPLIVNLVVSVFRFHSEAQNDTPVRRSGFCLATIIYSAVNAPKFVGYPKARGGTGRAASRLRHQPAAHVRGARQYK